MIMKKTSFIVLLVIYSFLPIVAQQNAKIVKDEAWKIVQKELSINDKSYVNVYVSNQIIKGGTIYNAMCEQEKTPQFDSWFFFIDDLPFGNWEHPCRYVYVNVDNGECLTYNKRRPPLIENMAPLVEQKSSDIPKQLFNFNKMPLYKLKQTRSVSDHNYAIIINGGYSSTINYERYWNDCSAMYKALINVYGYSKDHIYVLMADGTSPSYDRHLINGLYDSSPLDLDDDGIADIQYAATRSNIGNVFNTLSNLLSDEDDLFIFTTDHGGQIDGQHSIMYLWNDIMHDYEFASYINQLNVGNINICMGQCYSGGFIDNITNNNVVISTACRYDEVSYAMSSCLYDEFIYYWISAVTGETPSGTLVNADINNDGLVSLYEAFNYAEIQDTQNEHPQYVSNPSILGQITCLTNIWADVNLSGPLGISNSTVYAVNNLPPAYNIIWSINNSNFVLNPSSYSCTVSYNQEQQYDSAVLSATMTHNGNVIKTLTKQIYHIGEIEGCSVICSSNTYNTITLPDSFTVTWSIDNNYFHIIPSNNQCIVSCNNHSQHRVANLTATITKNGENITTLTKQIYSHGTSLEITGTQEEYVTINGYYPMQTISYSTDYAGCGYSSTNISVNEDCDIVIESDRFQGMEISFEGEGAPTNVAHMGNIISFHTQPYSVNFLPEQEDRGNFRFDIGGGITRPVSYPFTMQLWSDEGCSDFNLNFIVSTFAYLNDVNLQISTTSTTLYVHLMTAVGQPIGNGQYQQSTWYLSVINAQTGQTVTSQTVTGSDTTVNISNYNSGLYIVRAVHDGNTYTAKFIK